MAVLGWPATAAMATDKEKCEDHQQGQPQENSQADGVEDALVVFSQDGVPDGVEEGADSLHGWCRIR